MKKKGRPRRDELPLIRVALSLTNQSQKDLFDLAEFLGISASMAAEKCIAAFKLSASESAALKGLRESRELRRSDCDGNVPDQK